jgi:hypothetical protein
MSGPEVNLNDYVWVRLTPRGRDLLHKTPQRWVPDETDGWSKWQLWDLMNAFGTHLMIGFNVPFDPFIRLVPPETP